MKTIIVKVSPTLREIVRARLCLDFLSSDKRDIELKNKNEVESFINAAAYWSQPLSLGDNGWRKEQQAGLNGILIEVLKQVLKGEKSCREPLSEATAASTP